MKTHKATAHLYFHLGLGRHVICDTNTMHTSMPDRYVLLASQDVEFEVDKSDGELTQAQIDCLRDAKSKILAEAEAKSAQIDAQIQGLLAITHEPA